MDKEHKKIQMNWELDSCQRLPVSDLTVRIKWPRLCAQFANCIKTNSPANPKILDIGGGEGIFYTLIKETRPFYVAIEPSDMLIKNFHSTESSHICQGCGENLPVKTNLFNTIILKATLDHCIEPHKVLSESFRVLKPNGRIFMLLTNENAWYKRLLRKYSRSRKDIYNDDSHNFYFSDSEVEKLLKNAGFGDILMQHFDYFRAPVMIENALYRIFPQKILIGILNGIDSLGRKLIKDAGGTFLCQATKKV